MNNKYAFVSQIPGFVAVNDLNSKTLGISQDFVNILGWKSVEDALGKTTYETPCKVSEFADEFMKLDKKVIQTGEKMLTLDIQNYLTGWKFLLVERTPIKNVDGTITGIFGSCIDMTKATVFNSYFKLLQNDNNFFGGTIQPSSYVLTNAYCPLALTEKQENCLFLLLRGKSFKTIAKILKISPRTVESHLDSIKIKLGCQTKSELIEKAINQGFLFYVPEKLQKLNLEKIS